MNQFLADVLKGLQSSPKYLKSKYFYNKKGDELFRNIMDSEDYYLTKCESEIFEEQTENIVDLITTRHSNFDVVELGAGDATKSIYLLEEMLERKTINTYFPVDISDNIISILKKNLPERLPGLQLHGLHGEYLKMLKKAKDISDNIKIVLFLGSNIGNIPAKKVTAFCKLLRKQLNPGDLLLIGFDLKKDPHVIRAAYNDRDGYTKKFNLNLLSRINEELKANFDVGRFDHYPMYDPSTGAAKSFLVSTADQQVSIGDDAVISFAKNETIFMEISQKYTVEQTDEVAVHSGFIPIGHFFDERKWFADVIWKCV